MPNISGTVKDASGDFIQRIVRAYVRDTGMFVGQTLSDPATGFWSIATTTTKEHFVVVHDGVGNPKWDKVVFASHFEGANNSTSFVDVKGKTISPVGPVKLSTSQSKFGGSSAYFPGGAAYLTTPNSADFDMGTGDFDFHVDIFIPSGATFVDHQVSIFSAGRQDLSASGGGWDFHLYDNPSPIARLEKCLTNGTTVAFIWNLSGALTRGVWHDIYLRRIGGVSEVIFDGGSCGSTNLFKDVLLPVPNNNSILIGSGGSVANPNVWPFTGYMDELWVTKGGALSPYAPLTSSFIEGIVGGTRNGLIFDRVIPV